MRKFLATVSVMTILSALPVQASAEIPPSATEGQQVDVVRASIARQLISRIAKKFEEADRSQEFKKDPVAAQIANFPENEDLLLQVQLKKDYTIESPILAHVKDKELLISLRDLLLALEFPIQINTQSQTAQGWYIEEDKEFSLDAQKRVVTTAQGQFAFSQFVDVQDNDIYVPYKEIGLWFGLDLKPDISALGLAINSPVLLPIEAKLARLERGQRGKVGRGEPIQPRLKDENPARAVPLVDVSTTTSYTQQAKGHEEEDFKKLGGEAFIRTSGDIAGGTLNTLSSFDSKDPDKEYLTSFRGTFVEQSLDPTLLGPLKARRYELGDIYAPSVPLKIKNNYGVGARVSNIKPNRGTLLPSTEIRGTTFPNWDVELYRNNQLVSVQTVGDDGVYNFENVDLFGNENNFRVVLYGPQGERKEEEISIPVDTKRLARTESAYDLAVMSQDTQLYRKYDVRSKDAGEAAATGVYEVPIGEFSAATMGFEVGSNNTEQVYAGHAGISTIAGGTLFNLDGAIDQNNEMAAQLVARRDVGLHQVRNDTRVNTKDYGVINPTNRPRNIFSNRLSLNGPLPMGFGAHPRYNLDVGLGLRSNDEFSQSYKFGYNDILFNRLTFNQQLSYELDDDADAEEGETLTSQTALSGSYGRNRLRLSANYKLAPENELSIVQANYTRDLNDVLDFSLESNYRPNPSLTTTLAQLDWRAGFADISPSISYNSDDEMIAMLNTRFSLVKDPLSNNVKSFEDPITANGGISVFVFLDKNGDNVFNGDDEPVPDATIMAPQNGGEETTDETGHTFFTRLLNMRPTDIYVQEDTLGDPYWISGYSGFSVVPREGHVIKVEFPIHIGGEIDGTVFVRGEENKTRSLRGISLSLYDLKGKKVKSVVSESDGFYLMDRVPPGRYMMVVDNKEFEGKYARPKPQPILVKSTGSTMYGNNIYLREGTADVPVSFHADASDLKIDPSSLHGRSMFLNLGQFKSRLSMGLAWLKIRGQFKRELGDMEIMELPSESNPDLKTQFYTLRVLAYSDDMSEAYNKCKVLAANGQECAVEVVPEQMPERVATQETTAAVTP